MSAKAEAAKRFVSGLGVFAVFAIVGPIVGGLIYGLPVLVITLVAAEPAAGVMTWIGEVAQMLLGIVMFSVLFGGLPATVCGAFLGAMTSMGRQVSLWFAAGVGALAGGAFPLAMGATVSSDSSFTALIPLLVLFGLLGLLSALACALLCRRWGLMGSAVV